MPATTYGRRRPLRSLAAAKSGPSSWITAPSKTAAPSVVDFDDGTMEWIAAGIRIPETSV